ncbi:MAG TPA: DUF4296 domain-containing protein [Vicingus sp.]|nr:DUF4296 domain-containing protein [Flavobacteriales bacterium]HRN41678.1 DUF4296 domain-containing protein [Vicingus sp.]HRP60851.1 DUF4296 domain-containing protein [Vicingus sp.]
MLIRILIPVFLFFVSCQTKNEEVYLSKSTMATIIAEVELAQAVYKLQQINSPIDIISISNEIYSRNNTTEVDFNRSLRHYSQSPKDIDEIYSEVIEILVKKQVGFTR